MKYIAELLGYDLTTDKHLLVRIKFPRMIVDLLIPKDMLSAIAEHTELTKTPYLLTIPITNDLAFEFLDVYQDLINRNTEHLEVSHD